MFNSLYSALKIGFLTVIFLSLGSVQALCVTKKSENLRKGPGVNFEINWKVKKNTPLHKIARKGKWYKVRDVDGDVHWIYHKSVTSAYTCATVKVAEAYLRKGPGTQHPRIGSFAELRYTNFKMKYVKNGWARVQDGQGNNVWISRKLIWVN